MKDWKQFRKELLKDPAVKVEVEKLEPEYQLARQLIKARLDLHLTQAELAAKAGVKQAYIARLESGGANPTVATLLKVSSVLGQQLRLVAAK